MVWSSSLFIPQLFADPACFCIHPNLCPKILYQLVLPIYFWMCDLPLDHDQCTTACTLRKDWFPIFQKQTIANSSSARSGNLCPTSCPMLGFCLAWVCTGPVHAVRVTVSPYVQLSCSVQKIVFPQSHFLLLALTRFLHLPLQMRCSSLLFSATCPIVGLCVNHHLLLKVASQMKADRYTNL